MTVFSFDSYQDVIEKSKFELKKLEICRIHPDYDYLLFNITVSINHLFEWCIRDEELDEEKRLECIRRFNPYESRDDVARDFEKLYRKLSIFPDVNEKQLVVRQLCNKAKHFKKTGIEKQTRNEIAVCGVMCCGDRLGQFHYQYDVEINKSDIKLNTVLAEIHNEWESFMSEIV